MAELPNLSAFGTRKIGDLTMQTPFSKYVGLPLGELSQATSELSNKYKTNVEQSNKIETALANEVVHAKDETAKKQAIQNYQNHINSLKHEGNWEFGFQPIQQGMKEYTTDQYLGAAKSNYTNMQKWLEEQRKRVGAKDNGITQEMLDRSKMYNEATYKGIQKNAAGEFTGSWVNKTPTEFVDVNKMLEERIKDWKPDTKIGEYVKDPKTGNLRRIDGQIMPNGYYEMKTEEAVRFPEVKESLMQELRSDPKVQAMLNEDLFFDKWKKFGDNGQAGLEDVKKLYENLGVDFNKTDGKTNVLKQNLQKMSPQELDEEYNNLYKRVKEVNYVNPYAEKASYTKEGVHYLEDKYSLEAYKSNLAMQRATKLREMDNRVDQQTRNTQIFKNPFKSKANLKDELSSSFDPTLNKQESSMVGLSTLNPIMSVFGSMYATGKGVYNKVTKPTKTLQEAVKNPDFNQKHPLIKFLVNKHPQHQDETSDAYTDRIQKLQDNWGSDTFRALYREDINDAMSIQKKHSILGTATIGHDGKLIPGQLGAAVNQLFKWTDEDGSIHTGNMEDAANAMGYSGSNAVQNFIARSKSLGDLKAGTSLGNGNYFSTQTEDGKIRSFIVSGDSNSIENEKHNDGANTLQHLVDDPYQMQTPVVEIVTSSKDGQFTTSQYQAKVDESGTDYEKGIRKIDIYENGRKIGTETHQFIPTEDGKGRQDVLVGVTGFDKQGNEISDNRAVENGGIIKTLSKMTDATNPHKEWQNFNKFDQTGHFSNGFPKTKQYESNSDYQRTYNAGDADDNSSDNQSSDND